MITFIQNLIARYNGKRDAKKNMPLRSNDRTPFLREVIEKGRKRINRLTEIWLRQDSALKSNWLTTMNNEQGRRLKLKEAEVDFETAAGEYFKFHPEEESLPRNIGLKFLVYRVLLVIFVFADVYFTVIAFRIFKDSDALNVLVSLLLGVVLVTFVDKVGERIAMIKKNLSGIMIGAALTIVVALVVMFGFMRGIYLMKSDASEFTSWFFVVMNLFLVYGGIFYSYVIHKPGAVKLKNAEANLEYSRNKLQSALDKRLKAVTIREKYNNVVKQRVAGVVARVNELFHIYWKKNLRERTEPVEGAFNPEYVTIEIPEQLLNVDWDTIDFSSNPKNESKKSNHEYEEYENRKNGTVNADIAPN